MLDLYAGQVLIAGWMSGFTVGCRRCLVPAMRLRGIALGSSAAEIVSVLILPPLFYRIFTEDAFLKSNLSGYQDYASSAKQRLLPGVW